MRLAYDIVIDDGLADKMRMMARNARISEDDIVKRWLAFGIAWEVSGGDPAAMDGLSKMFGGILNMQSRITRK